MVTLKGRKVYLDANALIYAIELPDQFPNLRTGMLRALDEGAYVAVTSEITVPETIIGPRKAGNVANEGLFRTFLTPSANLLIEPVTRDVLEKVIELRANHSLKFADAIHVATGILRGCDLFLTADQAWARAGVTVADPADVE